jgi:folate-binding protein YgfZ
MNAPSDARVRELAQAARETGLLSLLGPGGHGMTNPGAVLVQGPDAAQFLHSQLTNDVTSLEPGEGQYTARVTRTGHLRQLVSLHALPGEQAHGFLLLTEKDQAPDLLEALDDFHFTDDLTLSNVSDAYRWITVQGPRAAEVLRTALGALGFEPWESLPAGGIRPLKRVKGQGALPAGCLALRRSLTGNVGFLLALPAESPEIVSQVMEALRGPAVALGLHELDPVALSPVLDTLRIEAGIPRVGPETTKRRLLPETGFEQHAVSYTKGCYLGQEVIARVRTYGSIPNLLRALIFDDPDAIHHLPEPGARLINTDGKKLGMFASSTWSPVAQAPLALAYLGRAHRTPGAVHALQIGDQVLSAKVALLPLYSAPDTPARVAFLYDRGIRTFAGGDENGALTILDEALTLDPSFADGYEAIGVILGRTGRFHEAIDLFRRLEEVAPEAPMVNTNLSLYYMKLGDKETAEAEAAKATQKNFAMAARARGKTFDAAEFNRQQEEAEHKDAQRKKAMFGQVLEFDPVDPIALYGMGSAHLRLHEYDDAQALLARAIDVQKNNSPVYLARGKALEQLERFDEAITVYRAGVEVASRKGDLMPLREMEHRLLLLGAQRS